MTISPVTQERTTPADYSHHEKLHNLLTRLAMVQKTYNGYIARCPAHDDRVPSLSVGIGDRWILVNCFSGCDPTSVIRAIGLEWKDLVLDKDEPVRRRSIGQRELELTAEACCLRLRNEPEVLKRLRFTRGWAAQALEHLHVGYDGSRLTLPVRTAEGKLHDVLRYDPFATHGHKILAGRGKSRLPFPAPEGFSKSGGRGAPPSRPAPRTLFLVEGEGTAISMFSVGLPAVALPGSLRGTHDVSRPGFWRGTGWHKTWAHRFAEFRHVILLPDCDGPGRALMAAARYDLEKAGIPVTLIDLGPKNWSGSDVADMLLSKAYDGPSRRAAKNVLREIVAERAEVLIAA